jgi:hypothetical protein
MTTEEVLASYSALDQLGGELDSLTLDLANSSATGSDVHVGDFGDVDASTAAGLFAVTQYVGENEREQTVVSTAPKKQSQLATTATQDFKRGNS